MGHQEQGCRVIARLPHAEEKAQGHEASAAPYSGMRAGDDAAADKLNSYEGARADDEGEDGVDEVEGDVGGMPWTEEMGVEVRLRGGWGEAEGASPLGCLRLEPDFHPMRLKVGLCGNARGCAENSLETNRRLPDR